MIRSWRSKALAFEGRLPVLRRERRSEKSSGSLSTKGVWSPEDSAAILEKKVFGPAEVSVCFVVWNSWPPTSMETMLESGLGNPTGSDPAKGGIFFSMISWMFFLPLEMWIQEKRGEEFVVFIVVVGKLGLL